MALKLLRQDTTPASERARVSSRGRAAYLGVEPCHVDPVDAAQPRVGTVRDLAEAHEVHEHVDLHDDLRG